jgi:transposase
MYFHVARKKYRDRTYEHLQLLESYREGQRTRQRVIHSFGNIAHLSEKQRRRLLSSLSRALGLERDHPPDLQALDSRHYADLLALRAIWEELQLPKVIRRLTGKRAVQFDVDLVSFVMVAHRLIDPGSKLALTRWLPQAYLQGYDLEALGVQHCYRGLDLLHDIQQEVEEALFLRLSNLFERDLSLVFYDLTSTYFEGHGSSKAAYGYSRDRRGDQKQLIIALAVDRRGLPISHLVFAGNRLDKTTLKEAVDNLQERFSIERTIFVADGGVMTAANIEQLTSSGYQHLIAVPKRQKLVRELVRGVEWTMDDVVGENVMARRMVREASPDLAHLVCYNPERAEQEAQIRNRRLIKGTEALQDVKRQVAEGHLKEHDEIVTVAARKLTQTGATKYFTTRSAGDADFDFELRDDTLAQAVALDGHYVLQTDDLALGPSDILGAYKTLQHVEHAFRELKDFIELRPIYHYNDSRVLGHIFVCMLAYLLERFLELRLEQAGIAQSARMALGKLDPVRLVRTQIEHKVLHCIIQRRPPGADEILAALNIPSLPVTLPA